MRTQPVAIRSVPRFNIGVPVGKSGVNLYGTEKIDNMIVLVKDIETGKMQTAGQVIPYFIDNVIDQVPYVVKEKIMVDVEAVADGVYRISFYSRGEASQQVGRVVRNKESGKFMTVKESPSLDMTILAYTDEAIVETSDERGEVLESVAELKMRERAAALGIKFIRTARSGLYQLPAGTSAFSIGGKEFKGGRYISGEQLDVWRNG